MALWAGRFSKEIDAGVNAFNSSISFDARMYRQDIEGSIAHATMLGDCGIIPKEDSVQIIQGLKEILDDLDNGKLEFDPNAEDIHMFVEAELTKRYGDVGKRLHTSRSRNDQVALDLRLYLRTEIAEIRALVRKLCKTLVNVAEQHTETVMPGYTHLQRAQPVTFAHHLLAYVQMLLRDLGRLDDTEKRMNVCPLGSGALAGTTYHINREQTAELLGFDAPMANSLDGVSDRDYCIELANAISLIMTQKKNPDITELIRGKTARVYGDLQTLFVMMKGTPLAYNKDMQEDKEAIFDAVDTVKLCLETFIPMIATMTVRKDNMRAAAAKGFINATDCADYLVKKGMPFRDAYKISGTLVAKCIRENLTLETLPLEAYQEMTPLFTEDIYDAISMKNCVERRNTIGAPGADAMLAVIEQNKKYLQEN